MPSPNQRRRLLLLAARALLPRVRPRPSSIRRVLLVRPDHVGDVLLSSAAVQLIREAFPSSHLTYLVGPWSVEAARYGPAVDEVWTLRFPGFTRSRPSNVAQPYAVLARWATHLRTERYDLAVVLRPDHWWGALLALAAGIPLRVGGVTPETQPLLTHSCGATPGEHWAVQALDIARLAIEATGTVPPQAERRVLFKVSDEARAEAAAYVSGAAGQRLIAIHPSAGAALKSWPVDRWADLAERIDASVVLTGAPPDRELLSCIAQRMSRKVSIACGQSLAVSAAVFEQCSLVIAPDSGAAHLAAAVGTPTLRLYGPASVKTFGPWPDSLNQRVLATTGLGCVPCGHMAQPPCGAERLPACMLALGVDDVLAAANDVLRQIDN